ncbi:hypothetical protein [Pontibacter beigongshangensis]|uniref:hypothetical protein n=1 Tax=Pontibacter beigongshangensis TaxID=2574733 RepID=UPI0016507A9F|nr:hypothetical protein [Pontibacter beigongshangensis]
MGKKKAVAEVLYADLDTTQSEKLYDSIYEYIKENDSLVFFSIMQYKFATLHNNPMNEHLEYKIMHFMMVKMQEYYPLVLDGMLKDLQGDPAIRAATQDK